MRELIPGVFFRQKLASHIERIQENLTDVQRERLTYYCQVEAVSPLPTDTLDLAHISRDKSTYYCDLTSFTRYFNPKLKLHSVFGDISSANKIPDFPAIMKSRPANGNFPQAVLFKMDQVRHNFRVSDPMPYADKIDKCVWRGAGHTEQRRNASRRYENNPRVDIGLVGGSQDGIVKPRMSIEHQLNHKFILSTQGHDLATNLHWAMASNSLCVMPKPQNEGWSMESWLQPDVHYVEVADDLSDIEEKMDKYLSDPALAEYVIHNAQTYVAQFYDEPSEFALRLMVLYRYFQRTGQME